MSKQQASVTPANVRRDSNDLPLVDTAGAAVNQLIQLGNERGYITYDELNATLPPDKNSTEQIEDIMAMISEMGIKPLVGPIMMRTLEDKINLSEFIMSQFND